MESQSEPKKTKAPRLVGLDFLRGLCALAVVLGHVNIPASTGGSIEALVRFCFRILSNGPAAVIVFFVISGMCIHYPQASGRSLHAPTFYSRRGIRILLPMGVGWILAWASGCLGAFNGVLWSLICEVVYYVLYPGLLVLARRWRWSTLLVASTVGALLLVATDPSAVEYPHFGPYLTWILGLPIWILGCMLAESLFHRPDAGPIARLWGARILVATGSMMVIVLLWKLGRHAVGFPWSLTAFGFVSWFWLGEELRHLRGAALPRWLDSAGAASYSIYLVHPIMIHVGWVLFGADAGAALWFRAFLVVASLAFGFLFFALVERPSHRLASSIDLRDESRR